jgi:hypothetical protein
LLTDTGGNLFDFDDSHRRRAHHVVRRRPARPLIKVGMKAIAGVDERVTQSAP